ncbi:MAG: response regulator [Anaerolineae bacterium]
MSIRILIVDDEKTLVYYLRQTLQLELPDSTIDTAYSGEEALSLLAGRSYDLILADMRMPGFDGLALSNTALEREAKQLGVDHNVDKPFDVAELMTTVHQLLGQEANADE